MPLPIGIDVEQYKRQAKELLKDARLGGADALARLRHHHPEHKAAAASAGVKLAEAQRVIARENGFASWARFKEYLVFRNAVAALDAGDVARLEATMDAQPSVLRYECRVGEWYEGGYFAGARLLWHVAGNPDRGPLPHNIIDVAKAIASRGIERSDADYTIGLLLTSRRASEAGVAVSLVDLLVEAGGRFDLGEPQLLSGPLLNAAPATARALVQRGATMDLRHAAALGMLAAMESALSKPTGRALVEEALAFAAIRDQREAAALLIAHGAVGDVLVSPGGSSSRTALHEAANRGFDGMVALLLAGGASAAVRDARWRGTAAEWADEGGFPLLAKRLREHERASPITP